MTKQAVVLYLFNHLWQYNRLFVLTKTADEL